MIEVQTPVAPERVTPIKPSEALRLGRLTRPRRIIGRCFDGDDGACALGAIAIGLGYDGPRDVEWKVYAFFLHLGVPRSPIYGLNDKGATDDEIVAYLEERGL